MSDFDEPQKNINITVEKAEWLEAEAFFKSNPNEAKFQKKFTVGGKEAGHSFIKIGNDIFALNNVSHMVHESDAGIGGFGRVKRGINQSGRRIVLKVEGKEEKELNGGNPDEVKYVDDLMKDMGYMLSRVEREVKEGEKGTVKAINHYQTGTKVLTAFEDRGTRDLLDEMNDNYDEYTKPPKNLAYGLKAMMGIEALHRLNIIHKDIKLENFVVNGEGNTLTVMPIDFDFSQRLKAGTNQVINIDSYGQPIVIGTPEILAPEIKSQGKYSFSTDVYALGVMLDKIALPQTLCQKMRAPNEADRISLPAAMEAIVQELKKTEYAQNPEVQQVLKQYEQFNFRMAAALSSSIANPSEQMTLALAHANKLPKEKLLEYTKNVMQAAVDIENEKKPPAVPNVPNLFRLSGSGDFYVAVTQLLLKKYGFPSDDFMRSIATQLKEISKEYQKFKDSGTARKQAEKKAAGMQFKNQEAKSTFVFAEEKAISERKLHELSANMKADIVSEFQNKAGAMLPVFDPIRTAVGASEKQQQDYMMAIFAGFCSLPLGKNPEIMKNDKSKIFSQLFSVIEEKNAAAIENKKLLQPLKELVNAPETQRAQMLIQQEQQRAQRVVQNTEQRTQQKQAQRSMLEKIGRAVTAFFVNDFSTKAAQAAYKGEIYVKQLRAPRANFKEVLGTLDMQGKTLGLNKKEQKAWRNNVMGPVALLASVDPKISPADLNQIVSKQLDKFVAKVTYDPEPDLKRAKQGGLKVEVVSLSEAQKSRNAQIKESIHKFKAELLPVKPSNNISESQVAIARELSNKLNIGKATVTANSSSPVLSDSPPSVPSGISILEANRHHSIKMVTDTPDTILLELKSTIEAFKGQGLEELGMRISFSDNNSSPQVSVKIMLENIDKIKKENPKAMEDNPALGLLESKLNNYKVRLDKFEEPKEQASTKPVVGRSRNQ